VLDPSQLESALRLRVQALVDGAPPRLADALDVAVFPGGARIRPRLCLAVAAADRVDAPELVLAVACGLELLHCASLVHDDLPCFDDAATRRGLPSVQRGFGEATAVLVGDALLVAAFDTVAAAASASPSRIAPLIGMLARASGSPSGLVAGQAWESEPHVVVDRYHRAKTASMFVAAAMAGAFAAGRDPGPWRSVGELLGRAYQVADDVLDAHGHVESAGKPVHQDSRLLRPSVVRELGTDGAVAYLRSLVARAAAAVPSCAGAEALRQLVVGFAERLLPAALRQTAA
jgi:geranylgeranyl diphosphate synthase type II